MTGKILSLFDGSGGFPLAAKMCGIEPVAASEIEPFPIRVTTKRFPNMKHLGDVSRINGAEIEPVDVITFGSPCQDLSIAGKRKGLNHSDLGDEETTRSGLFMEAMRIIREMKEATDGKYPSFAIWENVPGAYSSNKGEDFRIVLEEFEKTASGAEIYVPKPPKGRWLTAGEIVGDHYSIAWRTFDAQYWGVPQRRKRIYLVADFRGQRAGEILFERKSLRGDSETSREQRQRIASDAERSTGTDNSKRKILTAEYCMQAIGEYKESDKGSSMKTRDYKAATDLIIEKSPVVGTSHKPAYIVRRLTPLECCRLQGFPDWWCDGLETEEPTEEDLKFWRDIFETHRKTVTGSGKPKSDKQIIKWLKDPYSDSAIYKMWGNGIALPNALFVMLGITYELKKYKERQKEMNKIYRGWLISTVDKKKGTFKAVKDREAIIGTMEQIQREIDRKALEELTSED